MEGFKIIECTTNRIIVNREPQNEGEKTTMRLTAQDAIIREFLDCCFALEGKDTDLERERPC